MRIGRSSLAGACALLAILAGSCGGGGSTTGGTTPPPSSGVTIAISPLSATVGFGGTEQFTGLVTGSTNTAVTWSVTDGSGGTSNVGTISSAGLYTAPTATSASAPAVPQPVLVTAGQISSPSPVNVAVPELNPVNSVTVTATSQADTSKSASATVALSGLSILAAGQCQSSGTGLTCTARVTGTEISRSQLGGQTVNFFIAGYGIVAGTSYAISGSDIVVTQPSALNFQAASDGTPVVYFQIVVSPTAALGPRNIVVTNSGGELASFPGGLKITP